LNTSKTNKQRCTVAHEKGTRDNLGVFIFGSRWKSQRGGGGPSMPWTHKTTSAKNPLKIPTPCPCAQAPKTSHQKPSKGTPYDVTNCPKLNNSYTKTARKLEPPANSPSELPHDTKLTHLMTSLIGGVIIEKLKNSAICIEIQFAH